MLVENPACPSFGHTQLCGDMIHTSTTETSVLSFQLLEAFCLIALQATIFHLPAAVRDFRHAYRPDRLRTDLPWAFGTTT